MVGSHSSEVEPGEHIALSRRRAVEPLPLQVTTTAIDGARRVTAIGDIDAYTANIFESSARAALDGAHDVCLDLTAVDYCDSAGVAALVRVAKAADSANARVTVLSSDSVEQLFRLTGL